MRGKKRLNEKTMAMLQNSAIEYPEKTFEVRLIVFGPTGGAEASRTIKVLAQTVKGAKRICKSRYRRSEIKSVSVDAEVRGYTDSCLFSIDDF
jgi:hypothetical protein